MTSTGAAARSARGGPTACAEHPAAGEVRQRIASCAAEVVPTLAELVELYYRHVPVEELADADPAEAVAVVRSHRSLADQRVPGRPAIRIVQPAPTGDGRPSPAVILVVTDDMPYLVDSVISALTREGVQTHRLVHPIVVVRRDVTGELREVLSDADPDAPPAGASVESWMQLEIDDPGGADRVDALVARLTGVLHDVREVVEDSARMVETARGLADELTAGSLSLPAAEVADGAALLRWLADGHFTFLGYRRYELVRDDEDGPPALRAALASGLGVLRRDSLAARRLVAGPDSAAAPLARTLLVLTQASAPSTVYRPVHPNYLGVKTFDAAGEVTGEHRFLGMLTVTALHQNVLDIPVVRRRVREVIHRAGYPFESYSGQQMLEVIETYPRPELFSVDADTLYSTATGVLALAGRRRVRLFLRRETYGRFYSCLVYLPRDRYTTAARLAMQEILLAELHGTGLEYAARIGESQLAQVHFTVRTERAGGDGPETARPDPAQPDAARLQDLLAEAVRTWEDRFADAVGSATADATQRSGALFPEAYKEDFGPAEAVADLRRLDALVGSDSLGMSLYAPADPAAVAAGERRFKIYLTGTRVTLTAVLPVLQNMGVEVVDERPYEVHRADGMRCWIYDFGLRLDADVLARPVPEGPQRIRQRFSDAFAAAWRGEAEVDRFNALVLRAGLDWRQAAVLRTYAKYLRQMGSRYGQDYVEDVVLAHSEIAAQLSALFAARFDPDLDDTARPGDVATRAAELSTMIDEVSSLDADRILRSYLALIQATLRTNYYQCGRSYLSLKLDSSAIPDLPRPRPGSEIFVCSPRVEGVHLRFGPVARGGLRWSDRREDFRTEVLGLAKAQEVKNAVIVPVGAKGGFVVKRPPAPIGDPAADRTAVQAEGITCYRMFVSGLLDLTDNLVDGATRPPDRVVRHDGDDTYLVVAADKGTATFSDIANEVAAGYRFWLGDAFASGGSVGYDHKAMGITARGAWKSVRRHFRELGIDTQAEDFTVVGIGDMSGDVFGNGMLLSRHVRLVAAFDHRHVFVDPAPDPMTSYGERARLFDLGRSSWDDYDRSSISPGGGVWSRAAKAIPISEAARTALGIAAGVTRLAPAELIKAILLAPVDLLWNGGIGTYVKAGAETHGQAGDKANDAVRVNGAELRARVVAEGGNLGLTQLGRVEYARAGGKINTDAVDNSAGVDCSDHEVNIKVVLGRVVARGGLAAADRAALLAAMTDDVARLVLAHNVSQNAVLGVARAHAPAMVAVHGWLVADLEQRHKLDRTLQVLPSAAGFRALQQTGAGLSSPELATLLAHVKLALSHELLQSDLADVEVFARRLPEYFPGELAARFPADIAAHPLRGEIVVSLLTNEVVDGGGITFVFRLAAELTVTATDAVRAYAVTTGVFDLPALWREVAGLEHLMPTAVTDGLVLESRRLLDRACRWFLSNRPQPLAVGAETARFGGVVAQLAPRIGELLCGVEAEAMAENASRLASSGVPVPLARRVAGLLHTYGLLDVVEIAELAGHDSAAVGERQPMEVAELYFALSAHLGVDALLTAVSALQRGNRWHALARLALRDDLYGSLRAITLDVLGQSDPDEEATEKIARWEQANASRLARSRAALAELALVAQPDLATLSVAARQLRSLVR